jgi:hypothetical protein
MKTPTLFSDPVIALALGKRISRPVQPSLFRRLLRRLKVQA